MDGVRRGRNGTQNPGTQIKMRKLKAAVSHRERLVEELHADPKLARAYLAEAAKDDDSRVLISALHTVAEAQNQDVPTGGE